MADDNSILDTDAVPNVEMLARELEKIRSVVSTACGALRHMNVENSDEIALVLARHVDDPLCTLINNLEATIEVANG